MKLKIAKLNNQPEIFYTLQGEGVSIGKPSTFVRLAMCNLHCQWCDTPYTWNFVGSNFVHNEEQKYVVDDVSMEMSVEEVARIVQGLGCKNVVLTGGEPIIQQRALIELMLALKGYTFEVETNGTLEMSPQFRNYINQINCSPKLSNSGDPLKLRQTKAFAEYVSHPRAIFKFVVSRPGDIFEIRHMVKMFSISPERIILMPEGTDKNELAKTMYWLAQVAKNSGYRLTPRMHIDIWGAKRGV